MQGKGGGPKTAAGKARSRRNAYKHGLASELAALETFEDPEDWEYHRDGILESLQPEGYLEHVLAEQIAFALWKMRRVAAYQHFHTLNSMGGTRRDLEIGEAYGQGTIADGIFPEIPDDRVGAASMLRILPEARTLQKVMRYEAHLHRQYIQTLHELEAIQGRRRGERTPLARLDITGSPA